MSGEQYGGFSKDKFGEESGEDSGGFSRDEFGVIFENEFGEGRRGESGDDSENSPNKSFFKGPGFCICPKMHPSES